MNDSYQNIYIELDALLDTRFGTLWLMNEQHATELLYKDYHKRMLDNFQLLNPAIDQEAYEKAYAARDVEVLMNTRLTNMAYIINQISNDLEDEAIRSPHVNGVEITINTYPYKLNGIEIETMKDMVATMVGPLTGVSTVYEPLTSLSLRVIKEKYAAVILYNFREWLLGQNPHEMLANKAPRVKILAPAIYEKTIPTEKDLTDPDRGLVNAFAETEMEFLEYFHLVFTDIRFFSIVELA